MTSTTVDTRIRKLSTASERRVIDPDRDVPGHVGDGQLLPDELPERGRPEPRSHPRAADHAVS